MLWRLRHDADFASRQRAERLTLRIVGICFLLLSAYVTFESITSLVGRHAPQKSPAGIAIASASLIAMPLLSRAKRRIGADLGSAAMAADARQTDFCAYLSGILLGGLVLNAVFGLWWADPVAGLIMVPIIAKEGIAGLQGKSCCDACGPLSCRASAFSDVIHAVRARIGDYSVLMAAERMARDRSETRLFSEIISGRTAFRIIANHEIDHRFRQPDGEPTAVFDRGSEI